MKLRRGAGKGTQIYNGQNASAAFCPCAVSRHMTRISYFQESDNTPSIGLAISPIWRATRKAMKLTAGGVGRITRVSRFPCIYTFCLVVLTVNQITRGFRRGLVSAWTVPKSSSESEFSSFCPSMRWEISPIWQPIARVRKADNWWSFASR